MSDEKQETMVDIVADIRERAENAMRNGERLVHNEAVAMLLRSVADRLEAAAKRQEQAYLDQIRDAMNMWGHERYIAAHAQKPAVGNAAAMREALVSIRALIDDEPDGTPMIDAMKATVDAALSSPARNCDKRH